MASEERIDSYIDRAAVQSDTDYLLSELRKVAEAYKALSATKVDLSGAKSSKEFVDALKRANDEMTKSAKLTEADAKASVQAAKAKVEEAKARKLNADAADKEAKAAASNAKAKTEEAKTAAANAKAKTEEAKAAEAAAKAKADEEKASRASAKAAADEEKAKRASAKVTEEVANDYLQLSKAYNDAALKAKNYALVLGESNPVTKEAVAQAKAMYDTLYRVDQAVGQNQRNVGNYKSAFDGLGMSFTQVARELPSLTISTQQFALAISNNLPMVADEIRKAKTEIAQLKAEGKDTPSLFQRIGSSLISWQVGLSVGIALLTAYGPKLLEWANGLVRGTNAAKEAAEKQKELNEATLKGLEIAKEYENLRSQSFGTINRGLENQIAYLKAQGGEEEKILELEKQLARERQLLAQVKFNTTGGLKELYDLGNQLKAVTDDYKEFLKAPKDAAGDAVKFGSEEYNARKAQLDATLTLVKTQYEDQKAIVEEFYNANRDARIKDLENEKATEVERVRFFADELQYRADNLKELSKLESLNVQTQLDIRKAAYQLEKQILDGQKNEEIINAKGKTNEILFINQKYAVDRLKLEDKLNADLLTLRQDYLIKQKAAEKEANDLFAAQEQERADAAIATARAQQERVIAYKEEARDLELAALERRKTEGSIAEEDYQRERLRIEVKYAKEILDEEIRFTENVIRAAKARGDDVSAQEAELAALKLKLAKETNKAVDAENKKQAKSEADTLKQRQDLFKQLTAETINLAASVITGGYEKQKNAIQDQIDKLEEKKQKDIETANATIANEQDRAAAITTINARAAAEKERLERRQRELDQQKARFERAAAIARVIQETAINVIKYFGTPLAVLAGIIGALQIGTILAQPIPKYKHGRGTGKDEVAIVGDGGVAEVIERADGSIEVTPTTDTPVFLGAGDRVHKSVDSFLQNANRISNKNISVPSGPQSPDVAALIGGHFNRLENTIRNKRENHIGLKNGEFKTAVKQGGAWTEYINSNVYN